LAGIYIHIPFCTKACHYCDFHFSTSLKIKDELILAMVKEVNFRKNYIGLEKVNTIYFGGGTPSILNKKDLAFILNSIYNNFNISKNVEVTIEINPNDLTSKKINDYADLNINRFSVGVQSFCDEQLIKLNRSHNSNDIIKCINLIKDAGFTNFSIDLMYGLPEMSIRLWKETLEKAIKLNPTHLSCYCLTIEKKTVFHKMFLDGSLKIGSDDILKSQFLLMRKILISENFMHYEISNFAKPSYQSRHNSSYWSGEKYLGIGPSAHSYNGTIRSWNIKNNIKYIKSFDNEKYDFYKEELLTDKNKINEYILMGLRTSKGVSKKKIFAMLSEREQLNINRQIANFERLNLLLFKDNRYFLSEEGMILCDKITSDLFLV
tara:strand:+ start:455 stop:1585 length:1131 start_codon:yes stop_codon:yes gene_type:complete